MMFEVHDPADGSEESWGDEEELEKERNKKKKERSKHVHSSKMDEQPSSE